ncbi:alpha/beta hydrolase family protein [Cellulomonas hominis]
MVTFRHALRLQGADVEPVTIPYEGTVLHGYSYRAATAPGADDDPRPTVVMHNGFDGTAEELHFFGAAAAVERGYHVLTFDGPGQPAALRHDGLVFRADWQHVVTPVLDWLLTTRAEVDPERVALLGISMGGLLAPRAAADEHRLAACIAVDGVYDPGIIATREMPMPRDQAEELLRAPDMPEIDAALDAMMGRRRRADHLPDARLRGRGGSLLRRTARAAVRAPDRSAQRSAAVHGGRGRRRALPQRCPAARLRPDLRLAGRGAGRSVIRTTPETPPLDRNVRICVPSRSNLYRAV